MKSRMIKELKAYLNSMGISAKGFNCPNYDACSNGKPDFAKATEPTIGADYIKNELPRVLFVSLDPGSASHNPSERELVVIKGLKDAGFNPSKNKKPPHWYETHILAWMLLREFRPCLQLKNIVSYFAHINSAKCCENNKGNAMAEYLLFENCKSFIPREIEILAPDVLVTQGNPAREVVERGIYENKTECYDRAVILDTIEVGNKIYKIYVIIIEERDVIWFHTCHPAVPNNSYRDQKAACFEQWARVIHWYLTSNGWGDD